MSDETEKIDPEATREHRIYVERQNLETSKQRAITFREWAYFGLAILLGLMMIWALYSWKLANNVVAATHAKLDMTLDKLDGKIEAFGGLAKDGHALLAETTSAVHDLRGTEAELTGFISDAREHAASITNSVDGRLQKLDGLIASLEGVGTETKAQIKQNGDAVHAVLVEATSLVSDQKIKIAEAETALTRAANGLATTLETTNPKIANILDHADKLTIDADGTVTAFKGLVGERVTMKRSDGTDFISGTGLVGIVENFNGMSLDSRNKLHSIFYPEPARGFWGHTKQVFGYVLNPILEGGRIYFSIKSLPVRITELPIIRKQ